MLPFTVLEGQNVLHTQQSVSCISLWAGCPNLAVEMHMLGDCLYLYRELGDLVSAGM